MPWSNISARLYINDTVIQEKYGIDKWINKWNKF